MQGILSEYQRIMREELRLQGKDQDSTILLPLIKSPEEIEATVMQLSMFAKNALVERSYITRYHLGGRGYADESVSAHANLMTRLLDRALTFAYGPDFGEPDGLHPRTVDSFSYRHIMEAVAAHDLPENEIGDVPDNGARDEREKEKEEDTFFDGFAALYPKRDDELKTHALDPLKIRMRRLDTPTGRMLKVADKAAAIFMALTYDDSSRPLLKSLDDPDLSARDLEEMLICDWADGSFRRGSEMWTLDHFRIRRTIDLDDTGFFTAVVVMYTLMVHGRWYTWREEDYKRSTPRHFSTT